MNYTNEQDGINPELEHNEESSQLDEFWYDLKGEYLFGSIEDRFDTLAHYLMNYLAIVVDSNVYRIIETEIYYNDEKNHKDLYVHCDDEQLNVGKWYFNGFGLDITFGNKEKSIYGGILIRGIKKLGEQEKYISGPSNVLKELFSSFQNVISENNGFRIMELSQDFIHEFEEVPIKTRRIGLTQKKDDIEDYFNKPYRYIVDLCNDHKFKEKEKVVRNLLEKEIIKKEEVESILGYNIKTS